MAIISKPRSNSQGIVETTADLAQLNGRPGYQVLVKDVAIFEWLSTGVVDNDNIYPGLSGFWSKIIMSADITLPFTAEDSANKSLDVVADAASDVKYPSVKATKTYADSLVTGLLDDRGNFTPSLTSPGAWPTTGGSGTAGAIVKGDIWFCSASGFMGTTAVTAGASFRAVIDTPGQTNANWNVLSAGAISVSTPSLSQVTAVGSTTTSNITVENNASFSTIKVNSTGTNGTAEMGHDPIFKGYLRLNNGTNDAVLRANNLTSSRLDIQLPNANGTLALASQITTPTLDQVTTAGATSSTPITISGPSGAQATVASTGDASTARIEAFTGQGGALRLVNAFGAITRIRNANATGNKIIQLPDAEGTIALTSQLGEPYKVYTASFTISLSGVSNLTVFRNTIGNGSGDGVNDIAWTGDGANTNATMTGSTAFPSGKTWVQSTNYTSGGVSYGLYGRRISDTQVRYSSILTSNNSVGAGFSALIFIEIRVYP